MAGTEALRRGRAGVRKASSRSNRVASTHASGGAGSTFGHSLRVSTFGESHGGGVGCVVDGAPPRMQLSLDELQFELDRRRPGQSRLTTPRSESDTAEILSGIDNGFTLGTPISVLVRNKDQRPSDYGQMASAYRPSHADASYDFKYGTRAIAGGGRSSAREAIGRVAAGAIAKRILREACGTEVVGHVSSVGSVESNADLEAVTIADVEASPVRCPDESASERMVETIDSVRKSGNSCGGTVTCAVKAPPRGLGNPVFHKLEADLAHAMMSLPATKGFELGSGFAGTTLTGHEHNDEFVPDSERGMRLRTNRSGGTQGGISVGETIYFRVAFKPTSTIGREQNTVTRDGTEMELKARGRHDPCVVPRAVPMCEAMAALVLADHLLQHYAQTTLLSSKTSKLLRKGNSPFLDNGNGVSADETESTLRGEAATFSED